MPSFQERANNLFLSVLFVLLAAWQLDMHPAGMHSEHSYSTFQIARNIILTGQPSFDGLYVTNGFHLLWMAVLSGLAAPLAQTIPVETALIGVALLPVLIFAWITRPLVFVQILVAVYLTGFGTEGVFAALLFIALAWALQARSRAIVLVLTLAIVLTRIDYLICTGVLIIWAWAKDRQFLAPIIVGSLLGVIAYAAMHWAIAEELYSVSLLQKGVLQQATSLDGVLQRTIENFAAVENQIRIAAWLGAIVTLLISYFTLGIDRQRIIFNPLFHLALYAFLLVHGFVSTLGEWYFAAPLLVAIYAAGKASPDLKWRAAPAILFCIVIPIGASGVQFFQAWDASREYAKMIDSTSEVDGPVFAYEGSAYLAWRRHPVPVLNGNGVMSTFEFARNSGNAAWLTSYLAEHEVKQFAGTPELGVCPVPGLCCGARTLEPGADYPHRDAEHIDRIYIFKGGSPCPLLHSDQN
ncbi:MAG: hypothetical protein AAGC81_17700 [Pseudomonadota bacterium]